MAILKIEQAVDAAANYDKDRELEIKTLLSDLEVGFTATVLIQCKITAYRTSFEYFKRQYNLETQSNKGFQFLSTENPKEWKITRSR